MRGAGQEWDQKAADWNRGFALLEAFVAERGHARVPQTHHGDDYPLGTWVNFQRQSYRRRKLSADRIARLDGVKGWVWTVRSPETS